MISITKIFRFEAAHRLVGHDGKCQNMHGHSYKLEVTVQGCERELIEEEGSSKDMVMDFSDLKEIVNELVDEKFDHKFLNDTLDFRTTAENMVEYIGVEINSRLPLSVEVSKIRLWETENSYAEWRAL